MFRIESNVKSDVNIVSLNNKLVFIGEQVLIVERTEHCTPTLSLLISKLNYQVCCIKESGN